MGMIPAEQTVAIIEAVGEVVESATPPEPSFWEQWAGWIIIGLVCPVILLLIKTKLGKPKKPRW